MLKVTLQVRGGTGQSARPSQSVLSPHLFLCQPHPRTSPRNHHRPCVDHVEVGRPGFPVQHRAEVTKRQPATQLRPTDLLVVVFPFCLTYGLHAVKSHLFYRTVLGALTNTQWCNLHRNQDPELPSPHQPVSPAALLGQPRPTLGSWHPLICFLSLQLCLGRVSHKSGHTTRGLLKNPAISFMFGCAGSLLHVCFSRCGERGCSPAVRLNLLIVVASAAGEHGLGDGASVAAVPGL